MSDYANKLGSTAYYERFLANTTGSIAVNVSITNTSTAATLASVPAGLVLGYTYKIAATGIPALTTFANQGTTAIVLSAAATATNVAAASTITCVIPS